MLLYMGSPRWMEEFWTEIKLLKHLETHNNWEAGSSTWGLESRILKMLKVFYQSGEQRGFNWKTSNI